MSPKRSLSLRFRHTNPVYASFLRHTCYMPHPTHSTPFDHPNNAARNNNFVSVLSDVASSWCDALTCESTECCRNSGSNAAEILSYKTCITAHSLAVTCVYITLTDRKSILRRCQTRLRYVPQSITSCYCLIWKHSHSSPVHYRLLEMLHVFSL